MNGSPLHWLSTDKYARLLPRVFPGCAAFELRSRTGEKVWRFAITDHPPSDGTPVAWADAGGGLCRRLLPNGYTEFRHPLMTRESGRVGWLVVVYDTSIAVPLDSAPDALRRAIADATSMLQEELELHYECNQLASELAERYEELNLVYSTDDEVEYFEQGQEALKRLVHNCADYLDVGLAALVCRDRAVSLCEVNRRAAPRDPEPLFELLATAVYDKVESQVSPVVLNELDDGERHQLLADRSENLIAYPIIDDHGTAIGMLAVVARQERHTFSNGDRNLLEVMAKKASRIIHTHHDSLTGLMNRSGFESTLLDALNTSRANNVEHCLLHIDIDQLHVVNDLMGYQEGDALIRRVSRVLHQNLRDSDVLARLGGDEFAVLMPRCGLKQGYRVAEKLAAAVEEIEVIAANRQLNVSTSIGVAPITPETDGIVGLLAAAEIACKSAKEQGRNSIRVFEEDNTTLVRRTEQVEWLGRIQEALRNDLFTLFCQPVAPIDAGRGTPHYEVLLRLTDASGEHLSPALFMPAAERYQMMPMVDRWVIRAALRTLDACWDAFAGGHPVFCINLSGQSLTHPGFLSFVIDEFRGSKVPPNHICFEITETAAISNIDEAVALMATLRELGCRFALDDFGAGLSSFGYLKMLPVDYLKIDGSFVREVTSDDVSLSMVEAICRIGETMGLATIAEFVGDDETVTLLRGVGVDYVQGYGIGRPEPLDDALGDLLRIAATASA